MENFSTSILFVILIVCLFISAFFSASETAMMSLNRYKLKHQADEGNQSAKRAEQLLRNTERLLGTILLGNNFVNILATSIGTIIGIRLYGDYGVLVATVFLTVVLLIVSEVAPKTFAAIYPEKIALAVSRILRGVVIVLYPVVWLLNAVVSLMLKPFGIRVNRETSNALTNDELKTVVLSSSQKSISRERQDMLLSVLELEDVSVEEAMIPRNDLEAVDLNDPWEEVIEEITNFRHTRLLAYRDNLDQVQGILHLRDIITLYRENKLNSESLTGILRPCTFVPEGTPLRTQLLNFQKQKVRSGLVVDEYGDIQGLITVEDILTYIVGDVVSEEDDEDETPEIVQKQPEVYDVDGGVSLRNLNRELDLRLPLDGPNTLSGLIIETLGSFPEPDTKVEFDDCVVYVKTFEQGVVGKAEVCILPKDKDDD